MTSILEETLIDILDDIKDTQLRVSRLERKQYRSARSTVARYNTNAGNTVASGSTDVIDFEDQVIDTHSAVTTGASWNFATPSAGYYLVVVHLAFQSSSAWADAEILQIAIRNEGANVAAIQWTGLGATATNAGIIAGVVNAAKADAIDATVFQNSGSTLTMNTSAAQTVIDIMKV